MCRGPIPFRVCGKKGTVSQQSCWLFLLAFKFARPVLSRSSTSHSSPRLIIPVVANSSLPTRDIGPILVVENRDLTAILPSFVVVSLLFQAHTTKMPATTSEPKLELPMQAPSPALFRTQTGERGGDIVVTQQPVSCLRRGSGPK